jgi:orotate phosphoribosyltransferase
MWIKRVVEEIGHFDFQLSGLETASTPMIVGMPIYAQAFGINLSGFSIRKEQKTYAMKNWLEGGATEQPVMLLDDLSNSGNSLRKAYDILEWHSMETFTTAFTLVNKINHNVHKSNRDKDFMLPDNIKIMSLFNLDDFDLVGNVELH